MLRLPAVKPKSLIKVLQSVGFVQHRKMSGSHLVLKHADGRRTTIPVHTKKEVPRGTLLAILKDIKISKEDFLKLL